MDSMTVLDVLLAAGLTLRLIRLVITDDLGVWYVVNPVQTWANRGRGWRSGLAAGVDCPWCIGFWIGCAVLLSLYLVGGPGDAAGPWRWVAGAFTLNWVVAHVGPRLGDAG